MAKERQQEVGVTAPPAPVAPKFDPGKPYTDAIEKQQKYWVQNGWLYKRGSGVAVREA